MKIQSLFAFLFLVFLSACKNNGSHSGGAISSVLPSSTGGADEVMFVFPDMLATDQTKESIQTFFNKPYRILPKEENIFNISNVKYSAVNSLMLRYRNIVFIADLQQESGVLAKAKEVLSEEQFQKLENGEQKVFTLRNIWSKPQNIIFIFGEGPEDLQKTMEIHAESIQNRILKYDLEVYKTIAYIAGINGKLKEQWNEYHHIDYDIPADYKLSENDGNFVSLRKDIKKGMIFLFFDVINYSGPVPDVNYGIQLRNERGHYMSSNSENSYMSTDSTLGFIETKTIDGNIITYETSGLWRMENDFMGGPFITKYIIDQDNNRVIFLDGFMYAPGENKKKRYMRQVEAIFSTIEIN